MGQHVLPCRTVPWDIPAGFGASPPCCGAAFPEPEVLLPQWHFEGLEQPFAAQEQTRSPGFVVFLPFSPLQNSLMFGQSFTGAAGSGRVSVLALLWSTGCVALLTASGAGNITGSHKIIQPVMIQPQDEAR